MKQDLRDKLLKAGLVDKQTKKRADHRARLERTEDRKKGVDQETILEQKEREYAQRAEERRRQDKQRELARQREQRERELSAEQARKAAEKREEAERLREKHQARDLLQASMFLPQAPGPVLFHFVARSGGIRKLHVTTRIAHDLNSGQLAIAQLPGAGVERFGLVRRDVAERLLAEDPGLVRFFVTDPREELTKTPPIDEDRPPGKKGALRKFGPGGRGKGDRRDR